LTRYDLHRISLAIDKAIPGLIVRNTAESGTFWYVELNYDSPVLLTIFAMDDKLHSELAALVIALFMKGFENDFRKEIFGGIPLRSELALEITDVASMPDDIKAPVVEALAESPCQASRPVQIELDDGKTPTYIFLAGDIFSDMKVGEGRGGPLQILVGLAAIEVAHRLLRGSIELNVLQPKLVKLVRNSIS
jgi:hypothetical protein